MPSQSVNSNFLHKVATILFISHYCSEVGSRRKNTLSVYNQDYKKVETVYELYLLRMVFTSVSEPCSYLLYTIMCFTKW